MSVAAVRMMVVELEENGILSNWCGAMDASRRDGYNDKEIEPDVP